MPQCGAFAGGAGDRKEWPGDTPAPMPRAVAHPARASCADAGKTRAIEGSFHGMRVALQICIQLTRKLSMNNVIYIVGLIVVVGAVLSFLGLH